MYLKKIEQEEYNKNFCYIKHTQHEFLTKQRWRAEYNLKKG